MSERDELAALLAELPDADVSTLLRVARGLRVTMAPADDQTTGLPEWLRNAPVDDEPWTDGDEAAYQEGMADIAAGRVNSLAEVKQALGL